MWYVVQVRTGTEKEIITQCEKKIDHGILKRCFVPYYESNEEVQRRMAPGTENPVSGIRLYDYR